MSVYLGSILTGLAIIGLICLHSSGSLAFFCFFIAILLTWRVQSLSLLWKSIKWTLPFALPLILIHGILNPAFPSTMPLFSGISLKPDGAAYGLILTYRIWLITLVGAAWSYIKKDYIVDQFILWRLPLPVVILSAQAISTMNYIERRVHAVHLAQQARGLPIGPGILFRIRALVVMVIPVVLSTLSDAHEKSQCLHSRGLGLNKMVIPRQYKTPIQDYFIALLVFIAVLILFIADKI